MFQAHDTQLYTFFSLLSPAFNEAQLFVERDSSFKREEVHASADWHCTLLKELRVIPK